MRRSTIYVTTTFTAYHQWPEAPMDVAFLRDLHRHQFHVRLEVETSHDRQVEFFQLQRQLILFVREEFEEQVLGRTSCETLCERILNKFHRYDVRSVSVSEDGENGATLTEVTP